MDLFFTLTSYLSNIIIKLYTNHNCSLILLSSANKLDENIHVCLHHGANYVMIQNFKMPIVCKRRGLCVPQHIHIKAIVVFHILPWNKSSLKLIQVTGYSGSMFYDVGLRVVSNVCRSNRITGKIVGTIREMTVWAYMLVLSLLCDLKNSISWSVSFIVFCVAGQSVVEAYMGSPILIFEETLVGCSLQDLSL